MLYNKFKILLPSIRIFIRIFYYLLKIPNAPEIHPLLYILQEILKKDLNVESKYTKKFIF